MAGSLKRVRLKPQQPDFRVTQQLLGEGVVQPVGTLVVAFALSWLMVMEKPLEPPMPVAVMVNVVAVIPLHANVKLDVLAGQALCGVAVST